jgi:hypothetical protein
MQRERVCQQDDQVCQAAQRLRNGCLTIHKDSACRQRVQLLKARVSVSRTIGFAELRSGCAAEEHKGAWAAAGLLLPSQNPAAAGWPL